MTDMSMALIAVLIQLITAAAAYQYLTHRGDGNVQARDYFYPRFEYVPLMVMLGALIAAVFIFVRSFLRDDEGFMRALMHAEVMIWLCVLGYIDLRERIIPNSLIVAGLLLWLVLVLIDILIGGTPWDKLLVFSALGGIVCGGLLFVIALVVKSALGMGDVKMFFVLGLLYGLTDVYGILVFTVIAMGIVSIGLLITKKVNTKTMIPMAPFAVLGFFLSILAGM